MGKEASALARSPSLGVNKGLKSNFSVWIDYWSGVVNFSTLSDLLNFYTALAAFVGDTIQQSDRNYVAFKRYEYSYISATGLRFGYTASPVGLGFSSHVTLTGIFFRSIPLQHRLNVIRFLSRGRCTRLDIAVDDYDLSRVTFSEILYNCELGNYAHVDSYEYIESKFRGCKDKAPTIYLGARNSSKRLRIYDANQVHDILAIRWELQLRSDYAANCFANLSASFTFGEFLAKASGYVLASVDFIDRSNEGDLSSCPRLDFWQSFRDELFSCPQSLENFPKISSFERSCLWVFSQVAPTLAMIDACFGFDAFILWLQQVILPSGRARLSANQLAIISKYRLNEVRDIV